MQLDTLFSVGFTNITMVLIVKQTSSLVYYNVFQVQCKSFKEILDNIISGFYIYDTKLPIVSDWQLRSCLKYQLTFVLG